MKILQLSTKVPYPPKDGGAAGVFVFSKVLHYLGHSVAILAFNPQKHFVQKAEYADISSDINIQAIVVSTNPTWQKALLNLIFGNLPYQVERFINKDFETALINILITQNPDIVQLEGVYLCPYIPAIRKHCKAKIVLRAHNIEHLLWKDIACNEKNLVKRLYLNILAQRMKHYEIEQFSRVDGIISFTAEDLRVITSYQSKQSVKLIPFGVEIQPLIRDKRLNANAIAFIGALDWIPNQEALTWFVNESWPRIHQAFPMLFFHIAGRNAPAHLVSLLKKQPNIVFHGEVADSVKFLQQFSIMVVPLFSGSGIRVKIIEAMQQGVVVIASAKAVTGIPAKPGIHLLIANTADEYLSALTSLLADNELIRKISENALALIRENFDILAIGSQLTDFYKEIRND